jgi:hypothetical protein
MMLDLVQATSLCLFDACLSGRSPFCLHVLRTHVLLPLAVLICVQDSGKSPSPRSGSPGLQDLVDEDADNADDDANDGGVNATTEDREPGVSVASSSTDVTSALCSCH